jgi:hypothetical protein
MAHLPKTYNASPTVPDLSPYNTTMMTVGVRMPSSWFSLRALFIVASSRLVVTLAAKECGIYLAPSTIPGAGLGMYAGNKAYEKGDMVTFGDWHMGHESYDFLWEEYVWSHSQFTGK